MMSMLTHPHAKPKDVIVKDATAILSELRLIKDDREIELMRKAALVASIGIKTAVEAVKPGLTESQIAAEGEYAMRQTGAEEFWRTYVSSGPRTDKPWVPTDCELFLFEKNWFDSYTCNLRIYL
jgi:Xaa-Pro aminopeptidase